MGKPLVAVLTLSQKKRLINIIMRRVENESAFVEKSGYTLATLRRVLEEEL